MSDEKGYAATPYEVLIKQIMSASIPKNEREWAAQREITKLAAEVQSLESQLATARAEVFHDAAEIVLSRRRTYHQSDAIVRLMNQTLEGAASALRERAKKERGE